MIRGDSLIADTEFGLQIQDNSFLERIDLEHLTHVKRGSIGINNNPLLCHVDWLKNSLTITNSQIIDIRENSRDCKKQQQKRF